MSSQTRRDGGWWWRVLVGLVSLASFGGTGDGLGRAWAESAPRLVVSTPVSPPEWALLERELLRANAGACAEFFEKYFDQRGWLLCVERWGGDDGPDDAIENCNDWPLVHALGGADEVLAMYRWVWEGHLRQYTLARTTEVPFARDGMYYKEFPVTMDWLHNGEGLTVFNLQGLSDPGNLPFQQRVRRFAGFYLNEDPGAPNYDERHRLIRSLFNGSRGPLLRKATAVDWAGDPIEVKGRFRLGHGEDSYEAMLKHFEEYNDIIGDHPQNLLATSLPLNAYLLTGEEKYRRWLLEYVDAWCERARANGGILPSNIGLDGTIGGATGGKWYGGVYGWGFTVFDPGSGKPANRNTVGLGVVGFLNAYLLTGDLRYLDVWRGQIDAVNAQARVIDGKKQYPRMFGDQGWYDFQPAPYDQGLLEVAYLSQRPEDLARLGAHPWLEFLAGRNAGYPAQALRGDLAQIRARVQGMRADTTTPDTRLSDDPMQYNPASVGSLISLMLGGIHPGHRGSVLHSRLRYFDPAAQRAGLPEDVAALVDGLTADSVAVQLVNTSPLHRRRVLVQAGGYGEHVFDGVRVEEADLPLEGRLVEVVLEPGCGTRLQFQMRRYVPMHRPTMLLPWDRD
jgi:hypothetical protein